jgi:rubrerythrin
VFTLPDILDLAAQIERNGERAYRQAAGAAAGPLASLLGELADQEGEHCRWFEQAAVALAAEAAEAAPELAEMGRALLREVLGDASFSLDAEALAGAERPAILAAAIELERDTQIFYQMLAELVAEPAAAARLAEIIAEEQRHQRRLEALLARG